MSVESPGECVHLPLLLGAVPGFVEATRGHPVGEVRASQLRGEVCPDCGRRVALCYEGGDRWYEVRADGSLRVLREGRGASAWHMLREAKAYRRDRWRSRRR